MSRVDEAVEVTTGADGAPTRMRWGSQRFTVTDTPTRIGGVPDFVLDFVLDFVTHPPSPMRGWRFQGTADDGTSLVFDIAEGVCGDAWRLLRTYR